MTINIELQPYEEQALLEQARIDGDDLANYIHRILQAHIQNSKPSGVEPELNKSLIASFDDLIDKESIESCSGEFQGNDVHLIEQSRETHSKTSDSMAQAVFEVASEALKLTEADETGSLDPENWDAFRAYAHRVLDIVVNYLREIPTRPVWRPLPAAIKSAFNQPVPEGGSGFETVCDEAVRMILPYPTGNIHPRFFGWVHGSGNVGGLLPEIIAAAMNSNVGGREHIAVYVERQIIEWCRQIFGLPEGASGILVSGTSMANLMGLAVARDAMTLNLQTQEGLVSEPRFAIYTSTEAHCSIKKAIHILGLRSETLRVIPVERDFGIDIQALVTACAYDRAKGIHGVCVVATAGTANTGAIDNLQAVADICLEYGLWMHVDGAFGGLAVLSDEVAPKLSGIERADSIAFDFHKWLHVNYDAGCLLVRRRGDHFRPFETRQDYLSASPQGLAAGVPWFCELGLELSRPFRALKVWFALKEHGTKRFGEKISDNCHQAQYLGKLIEITPYLQLLSPITLNIVCFRFLSPAMKRLSAGVVDEINRDIVIKLQESGIAAPSMTRVNEATAIRVNLTNHRTKKTDLHALVEAVLKLGHLIAPQ